MLAVVHPGQYNPTPNLDRSTATRPTLSSSSSSSSSRPAIQVHVKSKPAPPPPPVPTPPPPAAPPATPPEFNLHAYPTPDLLRLLASLLTQIAATNDSLSPPSPTSLPHPVPSPLSASLTTASRGALTSPSSTLTFHARNIPTISLEAYLLRILKYCPTTNEVFLALLVYFDRMSKLSADSVGTAFVIDSYNIHRLVIAGVTVASKFFSDVFYTNSRYAKVGGLPLPELNQLELQFLLLNDFRLVISTAEMQRYAEQLILFSNSESDSPSTPSLQTHPTPPPIPPHAPTHPHTSAPLMANPIRTPNTHPSKHSPPPHAPTPALVESSDSATSEAETETETETEADTETTDDEPTIRPRGDSVAGSVYSHTSAGRERSESRSSGGHSRYSTGSISEVYDDGAGHRGAGVSGGRYVNGVNGGSSHSHSHGHGGGNSDAQSVHSFRSFGSSESGDTGDEGGDEGGDAYDYYADDNFDAEEDGGGDSDDEDDVRGRREAGLKDGWRGQGAVGGTGEEGEGDAEMEGLKTPGRRAGGGPMVRMRGRGKGKGVRAPGDYVMASP